MGFISLPVVFGTAVLVAETELPKLNTGLLGTTAAASFLFSAGFPKTNGVVDCLIVVTSGGFLAPNVKPSVGTDAAVVNLVELVSIVDALTIGVESAVSTD